MNTFLNEYSGFYKNEYLFLNEYSGFLKKEYLFWMNMLDSYKMNNFWNKYFGFSLPASKIVVARCLKLIWNHSGIINRTYFSPSQGVSYLYMGLRRAPKPYFGIILEVWIIFLIFFECVILLKILDSMDWIFQILFSIEFWIESLLGASKVQTWGFSGSRGTSGESHPRVPSWTSGGSLCGGLRCPIGSMATLDGSSDYL